MRLHAARSVPLHPNPVVQAGTPAGRADHPAGGWTRDRWNGVRLRSPSIVSSALIVDLAGDLPAGSVLDETAEAVSHRNKLLNGIPIPIEGTVGQYFIVPFGTRGCRPKGFLYRRNPQSGRGRSNSAKEIADLRADGTPM
jgi:hypothetical protein